LALQLRLETVLREDAFEAICFRRDPDQFSKDGSQALYDALLREIVLRLPHSVTFDPREASPAEIVAVLATFARGSAGLLTPVFTDDAERNSKIVAEGAADIGFLLAMAYHYDASLYLSGPVFMMISGVLRSTKIDGSVDAAGL
jgi:hypothetical protein